MIVSNNIFRTCAHSLEKFWGFVVYGFPGKYGCNGGVASFECAPPETHRLQNRLQPGGAVREELQHEGPCRP